jgi:ATP-dependent helicase HrpB
VEPLPIDPLLPRIVSALRDAPASRLVLRAPPGAGKTTRVPAALLDAGLAGAKEIVVLEPRRIAARAAAEFVARERGGELGGEIGYRVRYEQRGGPHTRLWFVTEGVFGRRLAHDPFLESAGIVILDEFHERHLQGDVALAIVRALERSVRPDLKLVVMSATLETGALAAALGDCVVLTSEGRVHPVEIEYAGSAGPAVPLVTRVAAAVTRALDAPARPAGDILVFLPGAAEIRRTATAIAPIAAARGVDVRVLHGDLSLDAQRDALRRGPHRRVVLSTNVAETALTVEGVTTVIDSGLARIARLDARHGINTIRVTPISKAAAEQRAGRAGRTAPGHCTRLWSHAEHIGRRDAETPEILRLDLGATALELRGWGVVRAADLPWLDAPPAAALARAERLLVLLGAVTPDDGTLTDTGRQMLRVPAPPRLARMLVEARRRGLGEAGALLAALASERDICRDSQTIGDGSRQARWPDGPSDLLLRLALFEDATARGGAPRAAGLDPGSVAAVRRARRQLVGALRATADGDAVGVTRGARRRGEPADREADSGEMLRCILSGFPDRVCRRRSPGSHRAVMVGGRGVVLDPASVVRRAELFIAVDVDAGRGQADARVRLASAIEREWLIDLFPGALVEITETLFDPEGERVVTRTVERYADLVLREHVRTDVERAAAGRLLAEAARATPARALRLGHDERGLLARIAFLARCLPELGLPADPDTLLVAVLDEFCAGRRSFAETRGLDAGAALRRALGHARLTALEREAPTHVVLPGGRHAPIDYAGEKPGVAARIQELFGLARTPRVARGRVPITMSILAPNQRPVQLTDDLESFWDSTYAAVRKELRGRYPKHDWPEDPLTATPSSRPGRRPRRR